MKGGVSMGRAQCVLGGSIPSVRQSSSAFALNVPGRTARLKSRTVASRAAGSSSNFWASSAMLLAITTGKTEGMKSFWDLLSKIEYAICLGRCANSRPQAAYRLGHRSSPSS